MKEQESLIERFRDALYYDESSPSFLRWRHDKINGNGRVFSRAGACAGSLKNTGYWVVNLDGKFRMAHRIVFAIHYGMLPSQVDHIDRNRANNNIANLRPANSAQNKWNASIRTDNTSGIKGVSLHKQSGKWRAQVYKNGKPIHIGLFHTKEEAENVIVMARISIHGKYSCNG
ncbi:HNH endonuclease [Salmonella enterica subsp. enterica]|nr:HNH endonuclease [Salmonella enterica subsp. enterica]